MNTPLPRKASREQRRQQIIEATISGIARRGLSDLTLSEIARTAGVSHGLVNFHFESKDKLLLATLQHLSDEYTSAIHAGLDAAGPAPAAQLDAVVLADLGEAVYTPNKIACWCAFWGESKVRPWYRQQRAPIETTFLGLLESLCAAVDAEGSYGTDPATAARTLRSLLVANWLEPLFEDFQADRSKRLALVYCYLSAQFPKHFSPRGRTGG